jgi:hypothetical protein
MNDDQEHAQLEANLRNIRAALSGEEARVRFIRETARELYTLAWGVGSIEQNQEGMTKELAWSAARALWDAKPEDC